MHSTIFNKRKIINDPVHGFITIPNELIFDLIQHPYFQRLRRIKQLGMSHLVYPGANHTRFHHALGAMHLMTKALQVLSNKGIEISDAEKEGVTIAILLHDIGHGPFSHTLEHSLLNNIHHEEMSLLFMERLNEEFDGKLTLAIEIFADKYKKSFLHELVSSQLDMDRLDYLQRDSYFTGVSEGVVGAERIITMLNVSDGNLVIEEKGIYSIENFISARRIMYWQVYMHKTVVSSEFMLINILKRASELFKSGINLFASPNLSTFLSENIEFKDFKNNKNLLHQFAMVDDSDIVCALKIWQDADDQILSDLCQNIIKRKLFKTEISPESFSNERIQEEKLAIQEHLDLNEEELNFYFQHGKLVNNAYDQTYKQINILMRDGNIKDLAKASDNLNISALATPVEKYCLCRYRIK